MDGGPERHLLRGNSCADNQVEKKNVKGYACAPSVLAGAAAMGVMVVALFAVLWYNGFLTEPLILVTAGPIEVGGVFGVFWFIKSSRSCF